MKFALFEVEPIGVDGALEANGRVYHFCSDKCRRIFECDAPVAAGESTDWIPGTVCDECGIPLIMPRQSDRDDPCCSAEEDNDGPES